MAPAERPKRILKIFILIVSVTEKLSKGSDPWPSWTMELVKSTENGINPCENIDTNRRLGPETGKIPTKAPSSRRIDLL